MVSSNQAGNDKDQNDHHHKVAKVSDPVELRTCTVDESFRRMEVRAFTSIATLRSYSLHSQFDWLPALYFTPVK